MTGKSREYEVKALKGGLKVIEFLAGGDILGWKSVQEVADASGVSKNRAFRILRTLRDCGWAEQGKKGFRQHGTGLMKHLVYAQRYLEHLEERLGIRRLGP